MKVCEYLEMLPDANGQALRLQCFPTLRIFLGSMSES